MVGNNLEAACLCRSDAQADQDSRQAGELRSRCPEPAGCRGSLRLSLQRLPVKVNSSQLTRPTPGLLQLATTMARQPTEVRELAEITAKERSQFQRLKWSLVGSAVLLSQAYMASLILKCAAGMVSNADVQFVMAFADKCICDCIHWIFTGKLIIDVFNAWTVRTDFQDAAAARREAAAARRAAVRRGGHQPGTS